MTNILKELKENQKICSVFSNSKNTNKFSVGFIVDFDDTFYLMECIDQNGMTDGYVCKLIDVIIKIEINDKYSNNIEKLFNFHKQKRYKTINCKNDVLVALLNYALNNKKICSIQLCESGYDDVIGFINGVKEERASIQIINETGEKDGEAEVYLKDINYLSCDSLEDRKFEYLFKLNN